MICEKCGKFNATTHIHSVVNGVVRDINLCSQCANKEGYATMSHNSLSGMLASMLGEATEQLSKKELKCPVCGVDFNYIAKTGKVGCAECYNVFHKDLLPYLKRVHGSIVHAGKIPNSAPLTIVNNEDNIENLRLQLNNLVREEKYEEAAIVRDKIRSLEGI